MNKATHTKGPWHMGRGNGEGSIFCESGRTRLESGGTTLYPVCDISRGWDEGEDEANARLIAAAPDLLEALKSCRSNMRILAKAAGCYSSFESADNAAREAIEKATGRATE